MRRMDYVRLYARRHAFRKAYTASVMGMDTDTSPHGEQLKERSHTVNDCGDPNLTTGIGGAVSASADGWSGMSNWPRSALMQCKSNNTRAGTGYG